MLFVVFQYCNFMLVLICGVSVLGIRWEVVGDSLGSRWEDVGKSFGSL